MDVLAIATVVGVDLSLWCSWRQSQFDFARARTGKCASLTAGNHANANRY